MDYWWIVMGAGAYVLGGIPFGKAIAGAVARMDITSRGSGNIGATNVARELGMKWGIVTLILDILKGMVPLLGLMYWLSPLSGGQETGLAVVGLCALVGHQFSPFMGLKGGKGVATALGVYLALSPVACLIALTVFIVSIAKWDYISLGSMLSAVTVPVALLARGETPGVIAVAIVMAALICLKHRENIQRLIKGEERKWKKRRRSAQTLQ